MDWFYSNLKIICVLTPFLILFVTTLFFWEKIKSAIVEKWYQFILYYEKVGGNPSKTVWVWHDQPSYLAKKVVLAFRFFRFLSPLQHIKKIKRNKKGTSGKVERNQLRPNFHARNSEKYFWNIAIVLSTFYFGGEVFNWIAESYGAHVLNDLHYLRSLTNNVISYGFVVFVWKTFLLVFAIETFTWMSYYLFWRNFAEQNYTLYHPIEYFVMFPLVLYVQVLCFSFLLHSEPMKIILNMLGGAENSIAWLRLLGVYYLVVVIVNLRTMLPKTNFKAANVINIIGAGDVVANNRLAHALLRKENPAGLTPEHLNIYTTNGNDSSIKQLQDLGVVPLVLDHGENHKMRERSIIKKLNASGAPTIIATPSESHFRYMSALNAIGQRYAVEKPISNMRYDINLLAKNSEKYKQNMFALSYYGLEKALPITYLLEGNYHYEKFLSVSGDSLDSSRSNDESYLRAEMPAVMDNLGQLKKLRIDLLEGVERSPISEKRQWTDLVFETFIHPLIITQKFIEYACQKDISILTDFTIATGTSLHPSSGGKETFIMLDGKISPEDKMETEISITLTAGKYIPNRLLNRSGVAEFENGNIEFNFDTMSAEIIYKNTDHKHVSLAVRSEYRRQKYSIQSDLMMEFFAHGWIDIRYDDFEDQLTVLDWILKNDLNPAPADKFEYDASNTNALSERISQLPPK